MAHAELKEDIVKYIVEMYGHNEFWGCETVWARAEAHGGRFSMPGAFGGGYRGISELKALSSETTKFRLVVKMEFHEEVEFWEQMAEVANELGDAWAYQECMAIIYQMENEAREPWMTESEALDLAHGRRTYSDIVGTGNRF